jgi:hypothetical protein
MELNVRADQTITAVRFRGDSCIISRAAASILTELIQGRTLQEVAVLPQEVLLTALNTNHSPRPDEVRPAASPCPTDRDYYLSLFVLRTDATQQSRRAILTAGSENYIICYLV